MKLSLLFSILPLALQSYAADAPEPAAAKLTLGPAPITELRPQVEKFNANRELLGNFTLSAQAQAAAACGVYLCEHPNFQGQCYWGCYPLGTPIYPDTYWVFRLSSVGPDPGARVVANYGDCVPYPAQPENKQTFEYPGGNLNSRLDNHMGCFWLA